MRSRRKRFNALAVAGIAAILSLTACAGVGPGSEEPGNNTGNNNGGGGAAGLAACVDDPNNCNSGEVKQGGEITFLVNQGHDGLYSNLSAAGNSVYMTQMLEGLTADVGDFNPAGEWEPNLDLFEKEPELVSEDPLTVKYTIRKEAVWSDGEPINIEDAQLLQKMLSGKKEDCNGCQPASTSFFDTTKSIEAEDEEGKIITITYDDGFKHPEWFARALIFGPAHVIDEQKLDWKNNPDDVKKAMDYFDKTVPEWSAGPYKVESWTPDETQVLVPNENWYGETKPALETLIKEVVPDQPSWVPATSNGELNGGTPASFTPDLMQQLEEIPGTSVGVSGSYSWDHVDMNMDRVSDKALRQAIFTAVNLEDAREKIWGELDKLPDMRTGLFIPQIAEHHGDQLTATGYGKGDAEAACKILTDAGYTNCEKGGQLTDPDGKPVGELVVKFLASNANRNTFAQLMQSYLAEIGVNLKIEATPDDQLGTVLSEADYDMVIFGWSGSPLIANSAYQFYHSTSESNFGNLKNDEIDRLTEEARNQVDLAETAKIHQETIKLVLDEGYSLPLWDTPNLMWVSEDYANMRDNGASSARAFYNNAEWGVRAE